MVISRLICWVNSVNGCNYTSSVMGAKPHVKWHDMVCLYATYNHRLFYMVAPKRVLAWKRKIYPNFFIHYIKNMVDKNSTPKLT